MLQARHGSPTEVQSALEALCLAYRGPLHAFAMNLGRSEADASDLVQDFLSKFVNSGGFLQANEGVGRLRNYLLRSLKNHLIDDWRRQSTVKRGVRHESISLDNGFDIESGFIPSMPPPSDEVFDREWAKDIMDKALKTLSDSYAVRGKSTLFAALLPMINDDRREPGDRSAFGEELGLGPNDLSVEIYRLRKRLGRTLRDIIADTVESPDDIEDELRYLASVLGS
ncbi:MAG: sigma-70 family RNA polymerase sigma factor [Verrucomicrobiae bacterium]|nr:sigma-70 family RNA polymerase sigma factor [Verrucomicrobiae bacterium]